MRANARGVRIDLTRDLPHRAQPLAPDALSAVFGGCKGEWVTCSANAECCTFKCYRMWWHSAERYWEYQCVPASTPG